MRDAILAAALGVALFPTPQASAAPRPQLAITIDDLPEHFGYPPGVTPEQVSRDMIAALRAGRVRDVYGFVNGVKIDDQPGLEHVLGNWRAAGLMLGNHGWSHRHLSEMSADEFEQELTRNEPVLRKLGAGTDWRWFRYPFLDEGENAGKRTASREVLAKHGYKIAAVSMSFGDWQWTEPYARCSAASDKVSVAELERMYLDAATASISESREAAHTLFGRDIPYVLLMHVSAMSAHMMPRLIRLYRNAGFQFVSLPKAESDPAYAGYTDLRLAPPQSPQELAKAKGVRLPQPVDYGTRLAAMCQAAPKS